MMDRNHMQSEIDATTTDSPVLFQSGPVGLMVFFWSIGLDLKTLIMEWNTQRGMMPTLT
jgi:hypothetical protein